MEKYLSKDGLEYLIEGLDPRYAKERDLADVAKSGSYDDLTDKPSIPSTPGDIDAMPASTTLADLGGIALTEKGANSGVAPLNTGGKIDSQYLPSYVDDVIECYVVDGYEAFSANWLSKTEGGNPLLPEGDKIYVILSSGDYLNKVYRWGGTAYVSIGGDIDLSAYATQTWVQNQGYLTSHQDISGKADSSSLASVATSGDYTDLTNKPTIPTIPTNVSSFINDAGYLTQHQDISSKANSADLATVATSGDYDDLLNKPTIPDEMGINQIVVATDGQGESIYLDSIISRFGSDIASKADRSSLASVATSGDYTDLINKPTIPSIPSNVSAFTNDAGYLTQHQSLSGYATETWVGNQGFLTSHQDISGKVDSSDLATVATSGDYDDLINKPTIPQGLFVEKDSKGNVEQYILTGNSFVGSNTHDNLIFGSSNSLAISNNSIIFGDNNSISNKSYVALIGQNLTSGTSGALHIGNLNHTGSANSNFSFTIGNGDITKVNPRSNAFAVDGVTGDVLLSGNIYIGCTDWSQADGGGTLLTAFSGSYNDLTNKPTLFSGSYNDLTDKPTLFSGSYNDLTNKPTIPAAYTLPTASTSTLGGVKVDGSTITINNGVISASGSSSYTAGSGIDITNGVISFDNDVLEDVVWEEDLGEFVTKTWDDGADISFSIDSLESPGFSVTESMNFSEDEEPLIQPINTLSINNAFVEINSFEYDQEDPTIINTQFYNCLDSGGFISGREDLDENGSAVLTQRVSVSNEGITFEYTDDSNGEDTIETDAHISFDGATGEIQIGGASILTTDSVAPLLDANISGLPIDTDGTYMLVCTVSDGEAFSTWESITIGGSY